MAKPPTKEYKSARASPNEPEPKEPPRKQLQLLLLSIVGALIIVILTKNLTGVKVTANESPPPTEEEWKLLYEAFQQAKADSNDPHDEKLANDILNSGLCGFRVPFEVKQSVGKGRGIFSTSFIQKDTAVWESRSGVFSKESEWRQFLSLLPKSLAEDAVEWAYVMELENESQIVGLDLDQGSLINHGESPTSNEDQMKNCANLEERTGDDDIVRLFASRDIQPDEELLMDYNEFHIRKHNLPWFTDISKQYGRSNDEDVYLAESEDY